MGNQKQKKYCSDEGEKDVVFERPHNSCHLHDLRGGSSADRFRLRQRGRNALFRSPFSPKAKMGNQKQKKYCSDEGEKDVVFERPHNSCHLGLLSFEMRCTEVGRMCISARSLCMPKEIMSVKSGHEFWNLKLCFTV